jgi:hypothetical protein
MNELTRGVFGSVMRSFDYRPHLIDKFTPNLQLIQVGSEETGGFTLDYSRFTISMASIVRGLFFYEFGKKLTKKISGAAFSKMLTENYQQAPFLNSILTAESKLPANYIGENPRVFQYTFNSSRSGKTEMCRLKFYEGDPICVTWKSDLAIQAVCK